MKYDVYCVLLLQFINSLEGLGMFFFSAALIRRLRRYTAAHIAVEMLESYQQVNIFIEYTLD